MLHLVRPTLLALVAGIIYIVFAGSLWNQRGEMRQKREPGFTLPSAVSKALALDHRGLVSDFVLLKAITFYGERLMHQQEMSTEDWSYFQKSLDVVTDLDPRFQDPYVLGESLLAWEAGQVDAANSLLQKGLKYRPNDWLIPFYLGFNYFNFQKDYKKGAEYLMLASEKPGSPSFLPTLAARLGYYGGQSRTAVLFLKGILAETSDERVRSGLEKRILAFEHAILLEDAVARYKAEKGKLPANLNALLADGVLEKLPEDPYGGRWEITADGRINSTSNFVSGG